MGAGDGGLTEPEEPEWGSGDENDMLRPPKLIGTKTFQFKSPTTFWSVDIFDTPR